MPGHWVDRERQMLRLSEPALSVACVAHCVERGYIPHWHCWEDNLASMAVADKVGFERPERYSTYRFGI